MASVNKVFLIGNLGKDPEVKYTQSGQAVCNFSVATSEQWNDKQGAKQERTEWHKIVAWGKTAELCGQYLSKGKSVHIEGKLQTREWEKDGHKNYSTEIVADRVTFLSSGNGQQSGQREERSQRQPDTGSQNRDQQGGPSEEDIPF